MIQLHDGKNCDFNGHAMKKPTTDLTSTNPSGPTNPPAPRETCKGNPNASNSKLCSGMDWACGPDQIYADIQVKIHTKL